MRFYVPAALLFALVVAAPAQATITSSVITTPKSPAYALSTGFDNAIEVAGTAKGVGNVDVVCAISSRSTVVERDVPVAADGTFSLFAPLDPLVDVTSPLPGQTCRLHAVPAGTTPDELTRFRGPVLAVSLFTTWNATADPNTGQRAGYYLWTAGADRATRIGAFGSCGLYSVVLDPLTLQEQDKGLACAGSTANAPGIAPPGVQVDGLAAYPAALADGYGLANLTGFPSLSYPDVEFDGNTGAVTVTEQDGFAKCGPDPTYPSNARTCTYLSAVPVHLRRTTSVLAGGQVVRVVDRWSSTDGQPHGLDLAIDHGRCCAARYVYRFPGESGFARHDRDTTTPETGTVAGPFAAAAPILARAEDGAGAGVAVVPLQSADSARFIRVDDFALEYRDRSVPATGELTFTHYYVTTRSAGELDDAAAKLIASLSPPKPPAPAPAPHGGGGQTVTPPAPPQLSRRGHVRVRLAGRTFRVVTRDRVTCAAGCVVEVRGRRIVPADLHVAPGRTAAVRFRLTRGGARKLRRAGRLRLHVALTAGAVTARRTLTVRAPA